MKFKELNRKQNIEQDKKLANRYALFEKLINELKKKEIPLEIVNSVNLNIEEINSFSGSNKGLLKKLREAQSRILKLIEKELKFVTKNHYRNMWLALGMAVFGIPFGVVIGLIIGNMAFIGIGLGMGMPFGIIIGTEMDKKAFKDRKQLDFEIRY